MGSVDERLRKPRRLTIGYLDDSSLTPMDVTFLVENKTLFSSAAVLSNVSPVFDRMFYGGFEREKPIVIEDVSFQAFSLFLNFIHNGTRSIAINLTPKDGIDTLLLANRYFVEKLGDYLRLKLLRSLNFENALEVLPLCQLQTNLGSIESKCWSVIQTDTKKVVQSKSFLTISWNLLCDILENSRLRISEKSLFDAAKRWAENQLKTHKKGSTSGKEILGVAIYKIRFPVMTRAEYLLVRSTQYLSPAEITDLETNFRNNTTFPNKHRRYLCACRKNNVECALCQHKENSIYGYVAVSKVSQNHGTSTGRCACGRLHPTPNFHVVRRNRIPSASKIMSTKNEDVNSNIVANPNVNIPESCECFKYKSCPSFPNGQTANILLNLGRI